jgi:hypothetical protein
MRLQRLFGFSYEDILASAFDAWLYGCRFGYCKLVMLAIILIIEIRYTIVEHFTGVADIAPYRGF